MEVKIIIPVDLSSEGGTERSPEAKDAEVRGHGIRDWMILSLIIIFVFISLPVSVTGNQGVINYFIFQQSLDKIAVSSDCLSIEQPCEIQLSDKTSMVFEMPYEVSSIYPFNVSAKFNNTTVKTVMLLFKGVEHSHGLRELTMSKQGDDAFGVQALLGFCGFGRMNWNAVMTVYTDEKAYQISIPFKSIDPNVI